MAVMVRSSRTQLWLESRGDWSWPGQGGAAVEFMPPPWVPAFPPRLEPAVDGPAARGSRRAERTRAQRLLLWALLSTVAAICLALAQGGQLTLTHLIAASSGTALEQEAPAISSAPATQFRPTLTAVSQDAAGSSIDAASYPSAALHGEGAFLTYLPPGYASTSAHYPVLYMLTGDDQSD